jgi:hypothetical protein
VHAAAAGVLLRLLEKCDDAEVRGGALETLLRLVEGAPANAHALLTQAGWQQWLIPALSKGASKGGDALMNDATAPSASDADKSVDRADANDASLRGESAGNSDLHEEARGLTRRLFRALLSHATLRVENGCAAVVTTGAYIAAAADRGRLDGLQTTRALLGDIFDAVSLEPPVAQFASVRRENLWGLVPLAEETVARAAAFAAGAVTTTPGPSGLSGEDKTNAQGRKSAFGEGDVSGKALDEDDWQMLDGTWRVLEELADVSATATEGGPGPGPGPGLGGAERAMSSASSGESLSRPGGFAAGDRESSARLAALQRTAFHLAIVYVHAAPLEAAAAAGSSLETLFPSLLSRPAGNADAAKAGAARLHLFLTSLVRAESLFAGADPARAQLAARLARGAASVGSALLALSPGSTSSLASLGGGGRGGPHRRRAGGIARAHLRAESRGSRRRGRARGSARGGRAARRRGGRRGCGGPGVFARAAGRARAGGAARCRAGGALRARAGAARRGARGARGRGADARPSVA